MRQDMSRRLKELEDAHAGASQDERISMLCKLPPAVLREINRQILSGNLRTQEDLDRVQTEELRKAGFEWDGRRNDFLPVRPPNRRRLRELP